MESNWEAGRGGSNGSSPARVGQRNYGSGGHFFALPWVLIAQLLLNMSCDFEIEIVLLLLTQIIPEDISVVRK